MASNRTSHSSSSTSTYGPTPDAKSHLTLLDGSSLSFENQSTPQSLPITSFLFENGTTSLLLYLRNKNVSDLLREADLHNEADSQHGFAVISERVPEWWENDYSVRAPANVPPWMHSMILCLLVFILITGVFCNVR